LKFLLQNFALFRLFSLKMPKIVNDEEAYGFIFGSKKGEREKLALLFPFTLYLI
jgi:hypothetical protein